MNYDYSKLPYNVLSKWQECLKVEFPGFNQPNDVKQQLKQIEDEMATREFAVIVRHDGQMLKELARWHTEQECLAMAEGFLGDCSLGGQTFEICVEQVSP